MHKYNIIFKTKVGNIG